MKAHLLVAVAALAVTTSFAGADAQTYSGSQVQLDDSFAGVHVQVDEAQSVWAGADAAGNVVSATATNADLTASNSQESHGDARARANVRVWHAWDSVTADSNAAGNGADFSAQNGALSVDSDQVASGETSAATRLRGGSSWNSAATSSANANVVRASAVDGDLTLRATQSSAGDTHSSVEADLCCVAGEAYASSAATANAIETAGSTTTLLTATRQDSSGAVTAHTDLYSGYADDALGSAQASANSFVANNEWGYVNVAATQSSASDVTAQSFVTLGGEWTNFASADASGVGNGVSVTNVGSDVVVATDQANGGAVRAAAALAGDGWDGAANANAYGNSVSVGACATCGESALTGANNQVNSGSVESVATLAVRRGGALTAHAQAIGNAATYSVSGN